MADYEANFTLEPQPTIEADFSINISNGDHNQLTNRDKADQHPISAITGLQDVLDTIPTDYVSDAELEAALLEKQDVVRDLSEIREGATLGATAVQPNDLNDYATLNYVDNELSEKQDTLTAGANIQIVGNTISATDTTYTAGTGISIVGNVISNTQTSAEWGNIIGTLSDQTDLKNVLDELDSAIDSNHREIGIIGQTIGTYGNIVTHDVSEFATVSQGTKADTALQPNDNITELTNNAGYITNSALSDYATITYVNIELNGKQDTLTQTQLDAVNSGANSTNIGQIATNTSDIADINALIPNQASSNNQLADKDFVNSSIATNTATFRGTFNSVAELEAYSGEKDNNDYAFVTGEDSLGNTYYDNYVYNGTAWAYRWRLNNSSFTAAQWSAINSGATSTNIGQITINANNIADLQTNKQNVISDLTTIRSNALAGKNASDTIATYGNIVTHNVNEFATSSQGALADTSLQPNDNISELTNDAGYITSASLPTVNNGTLDIQVNGTSVGTFTANQVGNTTANIVVPDSATWGNITGTLSNQTDLQSALDGKANDSNVVHKTGSETITGFKTFTNKAKITSSTSGAILELESGASNTNFLLKRTNGATCVLESGDTVGLFGTQSNHSLQIRTNYENRMTFDTSGNVTLAKAPSSDSNSRQVATTAWTISKIPTNNNQLTNGAGYITNSALAPYVLSSSLATVATSGSYNDLSNKPTIPTVNNATLTITQGGVSKGTFTANASSDVTIALDSGGDIDTLLATLYPVGAIYIGTQATCPLSTLISGSTWTIVGTSIITDVSIPSTIAVYGNGKTLGYTDGTNNLALLPGGDGRIYGMGYGYDKNIGTAGSGGNVTTNKYIGIVSDTSGKSGLVAKSNSITKTSITVNIWQRTA